MKKFSDFDIQITGYTGEERTLCPQCSTDRKKSNEKCLAVNIDKGTWICHHCGWSGGLQSRKEPVLKPLYQAGTLPANVIEYFQKRGIPESVLTANRIGYGQSWADKNGIQFPYFKGGVVVNIKHRSHDKFFRQEKNTEKCLYRFDEILKLEGNTLIITEGEIDALSFQTAGFSMVTSVPDGAPAVNAKTFTSKFDYLRGAEKILDHYSKIILAVDNDAPGKILEQELARRIGAEKCYRVKYPDGCKDGNDVLVKYGKNLVTGLIQNAIPFPIAGLFDSTDYEDEVLNLYDLGENRGVLTGWKDLDPFYSVKLGELTVVTGIPGSGKSNFIDNLIINILESQGWSFAIFSPENWPVQRHLSTLIEKIERKPFAKNGKYEERMSREDVIESLNCIRKNFCFIVPDELFTIETILDKARSAILRDGIRGLVIDPWNELDHLFEGKTEAQYLSEKLTKIRRFARMNAIHVWISAHPKNLLKDKDTGDYKPPTMYEISGGAQWRNKADNGLCVHRPDFSNDITEIYIQKVRFREVGKIGLARLIFCRDTGRYFDLKTI